jgi:hypothetical protein
LVDWRGRQRVDVREPQRGAAGAGSRDAGRAAGREARMGLREGSCKRKQ